MRRPACILAALLAILLAGAAVRAQAPQTISPDRANAQTTDGGFRRAYQNPYLDHALGGYAQTSCKAAIPIAVARTQRIFPWFDEERAPQFSFHANAALDTPASPWAGGYYLRDRHIVYVQHVPVLLDQGRLLQTMQHECVHAALALAGSARLPLWLEEGCALYFSGQEILRAPEGSRTARTLAELEANIQTLSAQNDQAAWEEVRASHAQARRIVSLLAGRLGAMHCVNFLRVLKNGTPFAQALASYYALEVRELYAWL
ncbi:MAG: hypothetical protein LBC99_02140 [Spirochaetota bacterium]|jgi:hypothetical protein|nr:hypothetical protein [Spirochaetota bacterium]